MLRAAHGWRRPPLPLPVASTTFNDRFAKNFSSAIIADFTGDGYAELLIVSTDISGNSGMLVVSASGVNNLNAGVNVGPALSLGNAFVGSATVGDFNGDGQPEIAALLGQAGEGNTDDQGRTPDTRGAGR